MEIAVVYRCFLSLFLLCICLSCRGCLEEERDALLQIKTSINGPVGTAFSSWYGEDCCQWDGVECDPSKTRVNSIFFQNRRDQSLFENWYPNATLFAQFKDLKELRLSGNQIEGFTSPHELQKLRHLHTLDLRDNKIESVHLCWGTLPSLYSLDLTRNEFGGYFPECLCDTLSLTDLFLSDNHLQGNISACLGNMTSLQSLDLSNNQFSGSFPSFLLHNLTRIESLTLSRNQFKGRVSFSIFANLSRLSQLDISYNHHLELETESSTWLPSFNMYSLNLAGCNLQSIPSFLSTQTHLESLVLSDNFLAGKFPSWLMHNTTSNLFGKGNRLSGPSPKTSRNITSQLSSLDISNNSFHGPLPEDIDLIFPELLHLDASSNGFRGSIPPSFGRFKRLLFLDLSSNKLRGEISYLMTGNMSSLQYLHLRENNFGGEALPNNSSLPKLEVLDLSRNDFVESSLQSLILPRLRVLLLRSNRLEGQIPQQLCQMRRLSLLDLSRNGLSGDIPDCIGNIGHTTLEPAQFGELRFLSGLDLSCNRLTGSIPVQVTHLITLIILNLSSNLLVGQIPQSLASMTYLESLDLSHNNLFGELSPELTAFEFLAFFNVSYNNLSGALPQGRQFSTFDESSYLGNPGLCGPPLERECQQSVEKSSYFFSNMATAYNLLFCFIFYLLF